MEVAVYLNKIIMKFLKSKRLGNHFKRINKATRVIKEIRVTWVTGLS